MQNHAIQRMGASRSAQSVFVAQWRLAPTADGARWTPTRTSERGVDGAGLPSEAHFWDLKLGPAKAHNLLWLTAFAESHI